MFNGCEICTPEKICNEHVLARINTLHYGGVGRALVAKQARWKTYPDKCATCARETEHDVKTRKCLECEDGDHTTARRYARRQGRPTFLSSCETHGGVSFSTKTGKCLRCYRTDGLPRQAPSPRTIARNAGAHKFLRLCETHGVETDHWVTNGKCSICYNAMGAPRPLARREAQGEPGSLELTRILSEVGCPAIVFSEIVGVELKDVFRWLSGMNDPLEYALLIARSLTPAFVAERARA